MLRYVQRGGDRQAALPGIPEWLSRVLLNRGIDTPEKAELFLHPSQEQLRDPFLFPDMEKACGLIRAAITAEEPICVYGDYDVDGVCSTAILLQQLRVMGAKADFRIPSRGEGYGMNCDAMKELAAQGVRLLITVDCGITCFDEVQLARQLGIRVIVTDHHECPEVLPPADAILNPKIGYPFHDLCGAGTALKLCQALGGMDAVRQGVDLAAMATVADVVRLIDENRVLVRMGLQDMKNCRRRGLRALMLLAQVKQPMTAEDISFRLGPRINAGGRLEEAAQCVTMLLSEEDEAERIARHLDDLNKERQGVQTAMLHEAERMLLSYDFRENLVILLSGRDWNRGIIGLTAGRLCERYHFPTVVLS